jgi:hypothetical protein
MLISWDSETSDSSLRPVTGLVAHPTERVPTKSHDAHTLVLISPLTIEV